MAPLSRSTSQALEHPVTPTVAGLLKLERTAAALEATEADPTPGQCHCAAEDLAAQLAELAPERLGEALGNEIRRWTEYLDGLAQRDGVDVQKLERLRSLLGQLERRLTEDWEDYFQRLAQDPWLGAYRGNPDADGGPRLGPHAWATLGPERAANRVGRWREELAPLRTAAETGLRLMRDSFNRRSVDCPPEGYPLDLASPATTGLVRVEGFGGHIPHIQPEGTGIRLRFRQPEDLSPATETVQTTLGWFTL